MAGWSRGKREGRRTRRERLAGDERWKKIIRVKRKGKPDARQAGE